MAAGLRLERVGAMDALDLLALILTHRRGGQVAISALEKILIFENSAGESRLHRCRSNSVPYLSIRARNPLHVCSALLEAAVSLVSYVGHLHKLPSIGQRLLIISSKFRRQPHFFARLNTSIAWTSCLASQVLSFTVYAS